MKDLLVYSERILMKRLKLICERTLLNKITKENVVELYEISKISSAEDLKDAALQFMGNNQMNFAGQLSKDYFKVAAAKDGGSFQEKRLVSKFIKLFRKLKK